MNANQQDRRQFLKGSAALAGLAAVGAGSLRSASGQTRTDYIPTDTTFTNTPLQDLFGIITPNELHFANSHGCPTPVIDPQQYRLLIHGLVDRPLIFTLDELKRLPSVSRVHFVQCAGQSALSLPDRLESKTNPASFPHGSIGCSEWTGVPLSVLLKEAGLQKGAKWLVAEGSEMKKHAISIPLAKAMDDALVAYGQNGAPVRPENGYPVKLLTPGWEGVRNVKWLRRIKVVDRPYMTKWEVKTYNNLKTDGKARWFQFEIEPKSVITFPSGGQRLPSRGFYEITGFAWSGGGVVRRAEVSTDGGRTWKDAQLQEPIHSKALTRFRLGWNWDGEEAILMSRCTDEWGDVQPSLAELSEIWGVNMDYWITSTNRIQHFNAIQPWKVTREGSVQNAMYMF